jgi:anti-sigma factor RsiW
MSECDRVRHSLGAYVLGALDVEDAAEVHRHLQDCPDCAAERDSLQPLPELLSVAVGAEAATAEPLSVAFEERLLDAYAHDRARAPSRGGWARFPRLRRRMRRRWMAAVAGVAGAVAAAAVAVVLLTGDEQGPRYNLALQNTGAVPQASAYGRLDSVSSGTELHLWVRGLPGDTQAVYEVVCEAPEWRTSAGTFRVNAKGRAYVILNTAMRRGEYDSIRIVRRSHDAAGEVVRRDILRTKLS